MISEPNERRTRQDPSSIPMLNEKYCKVDVYVCVRMFVTEEERGRGELWGCGRADYVIWWGASSISMRKVSIGVSPMSLKKNKCSRHLRPMERSAGNRNSSLANLSQHRRGEEKNKGQPWTCEIQRKKTPDFARTPVPQIDTWSSIAEF